MNILFVYNDYNDVRGISTVMAVAERFALNSNRGKFWVNTKPNPSIKFEDGGVVSVMPITKGIPNVEDYDKVYIDDSIATFMETEHFGHKFEFYDKNSFKS